MFKDKIRHSGRQQQEKMQRLKEGSKHSGDTALNSSAPLTAKSSACLEPCMFLGQKGSEDLCEENGRH